MSILNKMNNSIYKFNLLTNENTISKIYVFYGELYSNNNDNNKVNLEELFKKDPKNKLFNDPYTDLPIFDENEINSINKNNITVEFSKQQIHIDDSIGIIKFKLMNEFSKNTFSTEEIYLFSLEEEEIDPINIYQELTKNNKTDLTEIKFKNFLSNIVEIKDNLIPYPVNFNIQNKTTYTYDDIISLDFPGKKYLVSKIVGQKYFLIPNEYPYIYNPFIVEKYDENSEENMTRKSSLMNTHLLLNSGSIYNNNIYICLANDVLKSSENKKIKENLTIKIYYPFLFKENIFSLDELNNQKQKLVENNEKTINDSSFEDTNKSVDLFYDIYKNRQNELNYISKGVKYIKIIIRPIYLIKMPIDIIFKLIHATENNPLIKFNPASRSENIYRLYSNALATDGRKIPFLKKAAIFKLMRDIGKSKSVAVYIVYNNKEKRNTQSIICEFHDNGNIQIESEFDNLMLIDDINELIKDAVNPVINEIKVFMEKSGYTINLFQNIYDKNVDIEQLIYQTKIKVDKKINLNPIKGCISSVFIIESSKLKNVIDMRFKRVSNFNKNTSINAFINEKINQGFTKDYNNNDLIKDLINNYQISREEGVEIISKIVNEIQIKEGIKKGDIKIKINPGFKTTITSDYSGIIISVDNINDINYLNAIPIYLDTLVRLTQNQDSTNVPKKIINSLCSSGPKKDIILKDITEEYKEDEDESDYESDENKDEFKEDEDVFKYESENEIESDENLQLEKNKLLDYFFEQNNSDDENDEEIIGGNDNKDDTLKEGDVIDIDFVDNDDDNEDDNSEKEEIKNIKNIELNEENFQELDGMSLKNPNIFERKMQKYDPVLFLTKKDGKFNPYSRTCASNAKKQPILLTKEELDKINLEKPGFFKDEDVLKYGSDPKNPYYYICPRYWCLKTNSPIDPSEIIEVKNDKGEIVKKYHPTCGDVIPNDEKKVPKGAYIYEFFSKDEHDSQENDKYIKHFPGFVKEGKHPDKSLCIPCCFKNWNTPTHVKNKERCLPKEESIEIEDKMIDSEKQQEELSTKASSSKMQNISPPKKYNKKEEYIIGPDKSPLDEGRWGYLPLSIQHFLYEVNADCQISKSNTNIRPFHTCLLRHGVEINDSQSFIACIADAMFYGGVNIVPSIKEMKEIIISAINIDNFLEYQNGNLFINFEVKMNEIEDTTDAKILKDSYIEKYEKEYNNSKIYQVAKSSNNLSYFHKLIATFENFKNFLRDETVNIDYTYLWDIICKPNAKLFTQGINLIVLEIAYNDITDNINFICPTNHYSAELYNSHRKTLIIVKNGNYFEPIYSYRNEENKLKINKLFSEYDVQLSSTLKSLFKKIIKPMIRNTCLPLESMPKTYNFKRPLLLENLIKILNKLNYSIIFQIVNFEYKVIGVVCENNKEDRGFVPCYPSNINDTYNYVFMNNENLFTSYDKTVNFLNNLKNNSKGKIPCGIAYKIIEKNDDKEDEIVGLLTETNQFVQLSENYPLSKSTDTIETYYNTNFYVMDEKINSDNVDEERVDIIDKIKLETDLYNSFRNTIRILINDYNNKILREHIEEIIDAPYILYDDKLEQIVFSLKELVDDSILFVEENYDTSSSSQSCNITNNKECKLKIPKYNLINKNNDNEKFYYDKLADELIRYSRIKTFIFQPQIYLSFGNIDYNLKDDEIILLQSILTQEYFDGLIPTIMNKYVKYNGYDNIEPIKSQIYDNNKIKLNKIKNIDAEYIFKTTKEKISSGIWKKCFPKKFNEIIYDDIKEINNNGFYLIKDILKKKSIDLSINQIRLDLYQEYMKYISNETYKNNIIDILILEGKKNLGRQVKLNKLSFQNFIYNEDYYLTNFDLWLLFEKYKIPTIFISSKMIMETKYEKNIFVAYGDKKESFCFILTPANRIETVPKYSLIMSEEYELFFSLDLFSNEKCVMDINESFENKISIEEYLEKFDKSFVINKPGETKKQNKKLIIDEDQDEDQYNSNKDDNESNQTNNENKNQTKKQKTIVVIKTKTKKNKSKLKILE